MQTDNLDKQKKNIKTGICKIMKDTENTQPLSQNLQASQLRERCKTNEVFFSSFIDITPSRVYLNPDDRKNWVQIVNNESKKRRSQNKDESGKTNGLSNGQNGTHDSEEDDEEEEYQDDEQNEDFRYHRFDPRFFKTVSQILKDFETHNLKNKKNILKMSLTQTKLNKANSVGQPKSTAVKVLNKSQSKSSKNKEEKSEDAQEKEEISQPSEGKVNSNSSKKDQKRVSKFKEEKREAIKRQRLRYDSQSETQIVNIDHSEANSAENRKPILNKNGEVVYSKFDFTADKTLKSKKKDDKLTTLNAKPKDYKKLLKKLQEKREQVEELKLTEPEKASEMETKAKWKTAMDKAAGVKVKDDVGLLKKTVKRIEKKKEKSRKNWEERTKEVEEKKNKLQDKRRKNIDKRKEKNKEKK